MPVGQTDDPDQLTLVARGPARHARPARRATSLGARHARRATTERPTRRLAGEREAGRRRRYGDTSSLAGAFFWAGAPFGLAVVAAFAVLVALVALVALVSEDAASTVSAPASA